MSRILALLASGGLSLFLLGTVTGPAGVVAQSARIVDDFEQYDTGEPPSRWVRVDGRDEVRSVSESLEDGERFEILTENGNQFIRLYTKGEYIRFSLRNGNEFDWNLNEHPRLQWRWRALRLPQGASEKDKNDTGGSVYVTFGTDWLGRPKSIKYTYSSSLPVGTTISFGPLKVIVVESAQEPRTGNWKTETRHVANDYRQVFGDDPPDKPVSITLSGDSDTTGDESKVDVDDITLLPSRRSK